MIAIATSNFSNTAFYFILLHCWQMDFQPNQYQNCQISYAKKMWHINSIMIHVFTCSNMIQIWGQEILQCGIVFHFCHIIFSVCDLLISNKIYFEYHDKDANKMWQKIYRPVLKCDCKWRQAFLQRSKFLISWLSLFSLCLMN